MEGRTVKTHWLSYSGESTDEWSGGIATFSNGDIATAFSVSNSNGGSSVIVQRLNVDGEVVWSIDIGADYAPGAGSVLVGADDNVYVTGGTKTGTTGESGKNDSDVFAVALTSEGKRIWYQNYGIGIHEIGSSAVLDGNGNILLEGRVSEVNDQYSFIKDVPNFYGAEFSAGWRGFQLRINPVDGTVTRAYTTGSGNSGGGPIAVDRSRNIAFVAGYTFGAVNGVSTIGNGDPNGANTYLIARDEDNGTVLWTRMENWMRSNVVSQESENAIYFVDKGNLEKVNGSTGETIWSKVLLNTGYILSPIAGGGVLLSESESNGSLTIRHIDADGSETESQVISHTGALHPRSFIEQGDGTIQISGSTSGAILVDEDTTVVVNPKHAGRDSFVMQTKSAFSDAPKEEVDDRTWEEISYEDFETGASGWSINSTSSTSFYGNYLGDFDSRQQNVQVSKVYTVDRASATKIELDFIRFDSWSNEFIRFYVDDTLIFERVIDSNWNLDLVEAASVDGIDLTFAPNADYGNRGHSSYWNDQSFSVEIIVPEGKDSVRVAVASNLDQWVGDESWGIDNVRLSQSAVSDLVTPVIRGNSLYAIANGSSWNSARISAEKLGGALVTIEDGKENKFVFDNFGYDRETGKTISSGYWIGFTDQDQEGNWKWISEIDSQWMPSNFKPGVSGYEPNGNGDHAWVKSGFDLTRQGLPMRTREELEESVSDIFFSEGPSWDDTWESGEGTNYGVAEIPFIRRGDSAYVIVEGPTWEEAEANAVALGGHLVTINDSSENQWLIDSFDITGMYPVDPFRRNEEADLVAQPYWIGLTDMLIENSWVWTGEESNYTNWLDDRQFGGNGAPNGGVIENHAYLGGYFNGTWDDQPNSSPVPGLSKGIAEIPLAPNITPTGTPELTGNFKVGETISIDASTIEDADNFEGWTPTYEYSWEIANDPGMTMMMPIWESLDTPDATDGNESLEITDDLTGKLIRGVVSYLDGYGTKEVLASEAELIDSSLTTQRVISLPTGLTAKVGKVIEIPININQAQDLQALDLTVAFDPTLFSAPAAGGLIRSGSLTENWIFAGNIVSSNNAIKISGYDSTSLGSVDGDLAYLRLQVKGDAPRGEALLDLISASLNEDDIPADLLDGSLTITAPKVSIASDLKAPVGGSIGIPISIDDATDLQSIDLVFSYDPEVFTIPPTGTVVSGSDLTSDWSFTANTSIPGEITISGFGTTPLSDVEGGLINLNLKINSGIDTGTALLDLVSASFNEGAFTADLIDGTLELLPPTFQIIDVRQIPNGLALKLSEAPDLSQFNLYDGQDAASDAPDLLLSDANGTPVALSAHWQDESKELLLLTDEPLNDGNYTFTIDSRADGLISASTGELLDGNGDGTVGDALSTTITYAAPQHSLSIANTARGAGQFLAVNGRNTHDPLTGAPLAESNGLPIHLSTASSLTSFSGQLNYDSSLLLHDQLESALTAGADLPSDWSVQIDPSSTAGELRYAATGSTAITGNAKEILRFQASVAPEAAPPGRDINGNGLYGSSTLIDASFSSDQLTGAAIAIDPGLIALAYAGDTTGNGTLSSLDASRVQRVVVSLDSGFDAYDKINPVLIGDTTGNGSLSSLDASLIQQQVVGLPVDAFPPIPAV